MIQLPSIPQYLLESSICLIAFYGFYHYFLRKETFFQFNRFYLLGASLFSVILPIIDITIAQQAQTGGNMTAIVPLVQYSSVVQKTLQSNIESSTFYSVSIGDLIRIIYYIGIFLMALKFLHSLFEILEMIRKSNKLKSSDHIKLKTDNNIPASSFFSYIFWNDDENDFEIDHTKNTILDHELVHVKQWHSLDVIIMELLVILKWFNPLIYLYRNSLRKTHEYIADAYVSQSMGDKLTYAQILLKHNQPQYPQQITNTFYSFVRDRIEMLATKNSSALAKLKPLLIIPIGFMLMSLFSFNLADRLPTEFRNGLSAIEQSIENASDHVVINLTHSRRNFDWDFQWGEHIYARYGSQDENGEKHLSSNETLSLYDLLESIKSKPSYKKKGADMSFGFNLLITSESDTVSNIKIGIGELDDLEKNIEREITKHNTPFNITISNIHSANGNDNGGFTFRVERILNNYTYPYGEQPKDITFNWGKLRLSGNNSGFWGTRYFTNGRFTFASENFTIAKSELLNKISTNIEVYEDEQKIDFTENSEITLLINKKEIQKSEADWDPKEEKFVVPEGVRYVQSINEVYHGRQYSTVTEEYDFDKIKENGIDYLKSILNNINDGDAISIRILDSLDSPKIYSTFIKVTEPDAAYMPPYEVTLPPTSNSYNNFQVYYNAEDNKTYVKVDTTLSTNENIVNAYRNSTSYKLVHVPNFKTKTRVNDEHVLPVGTLLLDSEMDFTHGLQRLETLNEHYTLSDRMIRMDWGRMISMPGIGNFSLKEFKRSSSSNILLSAGDNYMEISRFDMVIIRQGYEPLRLRSDNIKSLMCRKEFSNIDSAASIYFDNIIIKVEDEFKYYPYQFVFNIE